MVISCLVLDCSAGETGRFARLTLQPGHVQEMMTYRATSQWITDGWMC